MAEIGIACASCPFYRSTNEKTGHCRYNPPHPFLVPGPPHTLSGQPQIVVQGAWVPVGANDYCGRHPMFGVSTAMPIDRRLAVGADGEA